MNSQDVRRNLCKCRLMQWMLLSYLWQQIEQ